MGRGVAGHPVLQSLLPPGFVLISDPVVLPALRGFSFGPVEGIVWGLHHRSAVPGAPPPGLSSLQYTRKGTSIH
ncbi:hypothetical protein GDO78_022488 [Eleutherodactylus coqui]|uniref:Uncharacterized protein n=1 Tax=Eleutherodactylus coqui TaxID=57060 RepID=A0A8J6B4N0_ELECQ|nr:hypothetical protein GDO78_022488 [Eleutherodactylus coqui]